MTRLANLPQSDFRADHYAEVELCERYDLFLAEELNESRNVVRVLYRWLAKYRRMVTFRNQTGPYGIPVGQIVANAGHIVNAAAANAGRSANTDEANADAGRSVNTDEANADAGRSANTDEANADAGRSVNTDEANKGQIVSVNRDNGVVPIPTTM
jgi:predicted transcriptional regulator